jgi:phosphoribosyl 1,2-cyclic phosphodiesterase
MRVTLWGTRGSLACSGPDTVRYGGDTSAVQVETEGGLLVLDAGTGIRPLGDALDPSVRRVDVLLSHLHMDHIQGLGFLRALFDPEIDVHVWGPAPAMAARLTRYLSPPLFPVRIRDLEAAVFHDVSPGTFDIGPFTITADLVCHPGITFGYRIQVAQASLAYLPDHEPALGNRAFPGSPEWTSGYGLCRDASLLVHDTQYLDDQYQERTGWGHSSVSHVLSFAGLSAVQSLVTFHHDPWHTDGMLDEVMDEIWSRQPGFEVIPGRARTTIEVDEATGDVDGGQPA